MSKDDDDEWMKAYDKSMGWQGDLLGDDDFSVGTPGKPWGGKHSTWGKQGNYANWKRCWEENHKPLKILNGEVFGGACAHPQKGYDIYIGFDHGMTFQNHSWPWEDEDDTVVEFLYPITDMSVPSAPKSFKKMIAWIAEQLEAGKKVHMGCIGGHGRTGLVLAALVAHVGITKKAIQYVRKHHCKKSVESSKQVNFLQKHFKVAKASASKGGSSFKGGGYKLHKGKNKGKGTRAKGPQTHAKIECVKSSGSIW